MSSERPSPNPNVSNLSVVNRGTAKQRIAVVLRGAVLVGLVALSASDPRFTGALQAFARGDSAPQGSRDAVSAYQSALRYDPGNPTILLRLADSSLAAHRPDMAAAYVRRLAQSDQQWTPELSRRMAAVLAAQGDYAQADVYWRASLTGTADDAIPLRQLADHALRLRDWQTAADWLTRLVALAPNDSAALHDLGLLIAATEPRNASQYLNRAATDERYAAIARDIDVVYADYVGDPFRLGVVMMQHQAWVFAERALSIATTIDPNNAAAFAFLGLAQDQQGIDGTPALTRALGLAPDDVTVHYALGVHYRLQGDPEAALDALERAGELDPTNPGIAAELGAVYREQGDLEGAATWYRLAVEFAPDDPAFKVLLATFYADTGYDLDGDGILVLQSIAQELPEDVDVLASFGYAMVSIGFVEEGRVHLEKAISIDPTNARARYYFGVMLERRGDLESALDSYFAVYTGDDEIFGNLAERALRRLGAFPGA